MQHNTMSNFTRRSLLVNDRKRNLLTRKKQVFWELEKVGFPRYELMRMEARYLPYIIHPFERIGGIVYGHHKDGFAVIVATNKRVIFLDKKPLFVNQDEITYRVVSGVSISHAGPGSTVTLHTRVKDYTIQTFNERCARIFIEFIEARCLEQLNLGEDNDYVTA